MALIKIKQTKKRWVVSLMSFNTTARIDIKCRISVFYCNTQITTFSFQVLVRRKSNIFPFFDSTSTFFLDC